MMTESKATTPAWRKILQRFAHILNSSHLNFLKGSFTFFNLSKHKTLLEGSTPIEKRFDSNKLETYLKCVWLVSTTVLLIALIEIQTVSGNTPGFATLCYLAWFVGLVLSHYNRTRFLELIMVSTLILPALLFGIYHSYYVPYFLPWVAALWGWLLPREFSRPWAFPSAWKWPLIYWMLILSTSWLFILLRECDFHPLLTLKSPQPAVNAIGVPLPLGLTIILSMILNQLVGFGWFGLLFRNFYEAEKFKEFTIRVIKPLYIGLFISYIIGFYQSFMDIRFLNRVRWIVRNVVGGGLLDPNLFGLSSVTLGFLVWFVPLRSSFFHSFLRFTVWAMSWGAAMISGSRMAFLMATSLTLVLVAVKIYSTPSWSRRLFFIIALVFAVLLAFYIGKRHFQGLPGALARMTPAIKAVKQGHIREMFQHLLWDRILFYKAAIEMIRYTNGLGVGPGSFHILAPDFGQYPDGQPLHVDNAQNWFLHQITELGILGLPGWLLWMLFFCRDILFKRALSHTLTSLCLKIFLILFGCFSFLGVHTQNPAILFLFLTIIFWLSLEVRPSNPSIVKTPHRWSRLSLALMGIFLSTFLIGQLVLSLTSLSPPIRAVRRGWNYEYGFYPAEHHPVFGSFRWTRKHAVTTLSVHSSKLVISYFVTHPDIHRNPVHVRVSVNNRVLIDTWIKDHDIHTRNIYLPSKFSRIFLRVDTNRTWRPSEYGSQDARELGVGLLIKDLNPGGEREEDTKNHSQGLFFSHPDSLNAIKSSSTYKIDSGI